jgi:hypothetical protein
MAETILTSEKIAKTKLSSDSENDGGGWRKSDKDRDNGDWATRQRGR